MNLIPADKNHVEPQPCSEAEAYEKHIEYLRSLTGEQRMEIAFDLSDKERQELTTDIKKQHPDFTKQQVKLEVIRRCYGEELFREISAAKGWKE